MTRICIIALGLLLAGCVGSKVPYPESWTALSTVEINSCPRLTGKYRAISVPHPEYNKTSCEAAVGKGWFCHSLPEDILGLKTKITDETWVAITEPSETTLDITVGEKDASRFNFVLSKGKQFECSDDGVVIKIGSEFMAGDGAVGINRGYKYAFRKALDGALIVKETTSGGGLIFLVIPVAGSSIQWWKWGPMR
jgi:hypothetical protein